VGDRAALDFVNHKDCTRFGLILTTDICPEGSFNVADGFDTYSEDEQEALNRE
jgi:hypothetical protein